MSEKVYSANDEDYEDCLDSLLDDVWSNGDLSLKAGSIIDIWEADKVKKKLSQYMPSDITESICENMFDDVQEVSESFDFDHLPKEAFKKLSVDLAEIVDQWANENQCEPSFYGVGNVRKIKVKFFEDGDYVVLDD